MGLDAAHSSSISTVSYLEPCVATCGDEACFNNLRSRARALSGAAESLCGGQSSVTSGRWFAEPCQTLLFFDWDDTLFPTEEIFHRWNLTDQAAEWDHIQLT